MRVNAGDMPFEIVDLSRVWVLADAYETDLGQARLPASLLLDDPTGDVVADHPSPQPRQLARCASFGGSRVNAQPCISSQSVPRHTASCRSVEAAVRDAFH